MRLVTALVALALVASAFADRPSAQTGGGASVSGQIIVKFLPGAADAARAEAHRQGNGRTLNQVARTGVELVAVTPGDETGAINRYQRNPNVLYAERNVIRSIPKPISNRKPTNHVPGSEIVPGDHYFDEQWALHNTGQEFYCLDFLGSDFCLYVGTPDADIDGPEAWMLGTGAGVKVAVIDTGIDYNHPDLAPNYIGGDDFVTPDGNPMDDHGHGTHVAGTVAAALNNLTGNPGDEEGVVGVAPNAKVLAYKVCDASGFCTDFAIQQAIARAILDGAQVINMSLGDPVYSQSLDDAVQDAWNAGIVIVAGAGNDGNANLFYPAALDHVISVGAFDEDGLRASFSNYGTWVDISAPGNVIMSSYPMSSCASGSVPGDMGCYTWLSGTSMATPHVAGAAALVWSRDDVTTNQQVVDILLNSADPQGVAPGRLDSWTIHGGLNIHDALSFGAESSNLPAVSVTASIAQASEAGPTSGEFTITRTGDTSTSLVVNYTVGGTATPDTDYVALPGSVTLAEGASSATIPVTVLDDAIFESNETVTVTIAAGADYNPGGPASNTVTIVSDELPPDLVVTSMVAPATGAADADIVVTDGTRNQGTGGSGPSSTGFYLSTNTTLDTADTFLGSRTVPALTPGTTNTLSTTLHIPPSKPAGSYYVIAKADWDSAIQEGVETNNVRASGVITIGPDLIVSAFTAPAAAAAGGSFTVSDTTKNQGFGNVGETTTRFYLSANFALDAADPEIGSRTVPPLAAGASNQVTNTMVTLPASTAAGTYYLIAQADASGAVSETSESNNTRATSTTVAVGPDLVVTAVSVPASTAAGATITVSETTKNQGGGPAAPSSTGFYLSANYSLDAADTFLGSRTVPALTPGTSNTLSTTLQIPPSQPAGSYYVIAKADWDSAMQEGIETNNVRVSAAMAIGPDLIVSALTTPTAATAGGTYTVSDTTKNQGLGSAGETTTRFYLSSNFVLDTSDQLIGSRTVPPLVAGASNQATNTVVTIPASTAPGSYYIIAQADAAGAVTETSESNNTRGSNSVAVGPDLVVTAVSAPASAAAGAMITVTDTTKNQGGAASAASSTAFYLSANYIFDASDTYLGSRPVGALAASGLETASTPLQIPAGFPSGRYYVLARADWNAAVTETVETNNDRVSPTTVAIGGDLAVTAATVSATGKANGLVTVTDTTANPGTASLPASSTGFYLSTNSTFGTDDVFLGSRAVGALAPSASESGSTQVTVPANTAPGSYFVFAVADWNNTVLEANEANNGRITSSVRIGPDLTVSALTAPTSAVAGSTISASDTTLNQGGDEAQASVTTFYLSANSVFDAADIAIGTREVTAVGPGLSNIGSALVTIPASTAAATYYIIAKADGGDSIAEAFETNNTRAKLITISAAPAP